MGVGKGNCLHSVYLIIGISEPTYTEEQLRNIDPKPFTYEGKKYTAYEAQQQMRKMERAMRKQKDRCIVADAAGDKDNFTAASIKLRRQKDIYEDFCKAADSYTQYERTFVAGYDRRLAGKSVYAANKAYLKEMHEYNIESPPKTLAKFNELRYNNPKEYYKINSYISSVKNGMLSPLVGYSLYSEYHDIIETQVVGTNTSNGIVITGQSKHFLERVFGTLKDPKTGTHRSGIPLESVIDTLHNGTPRPPKGNKPDSSQAFVLNGYLVTINPDTGKLIQCNIYIR